MRYANTRFCNNLDEIIFPGVGPLEIPEIKPERWEDGLEFIDFNRAMS